MRKLLLCSAAAALAAGAAMAQTDTGTPPATPEDGGQAPIAQGAETTSGDGATVIVATTSEPQGMFQAGTDSMALRASDFIGKSVFVTGTADGMDVPGGQANPMAGEGMWTTDRMYADETMLGTRDGWENVGDVNDVILSGDGRVQAVLLDIGGFLGMGERTVAVGMDSLRFAPADGAAMPATEGPGTADLSDFILVVQADRAALENAPEYEGMRVGPGMAPTAMQGQGMQDAEVLVTPDAAEEMADDGQLLTDRPGSVAQDGAVATSDGGTTTITDSGGMRREPMMGREGMIAADEGYMTTEYLTGARVYDANDEWVGDIGELVLDASGQVTQAIIDVGGFLGIGEKPVAIPLDRMELLRSETGDEIRAYVSMTEEELEALPAYDR